MSMGGLPMQELVNAMLVLTQFGTCVSYCIFISTSLSALLSGEEDPLHYYDTVLWVLVLGLLILTYRDVSAAWLGRT